MKKIGLLLLLVTVTGIAQVKGNKKSTTQIFDVNGLTDLEMGLYATVTIDASATAEMTITTDSNLIDLIDTEIVGGTMKLTQKEWIQPSGAILITIGAPALKRLQVDVHETVILKNVQRDDLSLMAIHGKIIVSGIAQQIGIGAEGGTIDASALEANEVFLNIWGDGKAIVNASDLLEGTLSKEARITLVKEPLKVNRAIKRKVSIVDTPTNTENRYIAIKIKNNSWNRNHFAVRGPKADGSHFGYGFPMMPGAVKKERWTVGTKIYKVNKLGFKKLLVTITDEDEDKTIHLFE